MYLLFRAPEDRGDRNSAVSTPSRTPQGSVLVIDDEPDVLRSISRVLERHGYRTHRAATGEDGVRQWKFHRPDVTLCDLRLPGINGLAVLERLKARQGIVIVFSGQGEIEDAVEAMRRGAETFLTKPVEMDHLLQAVSRATEKAHLLREVQDLRARPHTAIYARHRKVLTVLVVLSIAIGLAIGKWWEALAALFGFSFFTK